MFLRTHCLLFLTLLPTLSQELGARRAQGERSPAEEAAEPLYRAARAASGDEASAVLDRLADALRAGACPTRALTDPAFGRLHALRRFRELIREHAHQSRIVMVLPDEAGEPLEVSGTVRTTDGRPVPNALVYVFQTDASGLYSPQSMDERNPRLFGYLRTDADGHYAFRTIRPGHYPDEDEPVEQHVHLEITAPGHETSPARLGFADDPFWMAHKGGLVPSWAVPVSRTPDGRQRCTLDLTLPTATSTR